MVGVYSGSYLNVIAGHAQEHEALFSERDPLAMTPCIIACSLFSDLLNIFALGELPQMSERIQEMPTETRGWIFQECLLSPRVVFFDRDEIFWRCHAVSETEWSACHLDRGSAQRLYHDPTKETLGLLASGRTSISPAQQLWTWQNIVRNYAWRELTKDVDRLMALAGVAELLHRRVQGGLGRYIAGLWESGFERQLCWSPRSDGYGECDNRHPSVYLAPSWSWATHLNGIEPSPAVFGTQRPWFSFLEDLQISTKLVDTQFGPVEDGCFVANVNLCKARFQQSGRDWLNGLRFGLCLDLQNRHGEHEAVDLPAVFKFDSTDPKDLRNQSLFLMPLFFEGRQGLESLMPVTRRLFAEWQLQTSSEIVENRDVISLLVRAGEDCFEYFSAHALILLKASRARGEFRRVGYL